MISISLCMIVRNESEALSECLTSAAPIADEIIIVDTGSDDGTVEIAEKYTENIFRFDWTDDFSAARNYSFSKATCDYIMWLDADDVIDGDAAEKFKRLKHELSPDTDAVMMKYEVPGTSGRKSGIWFYRERLLKRSSSFRWEGAVHEFIAPKGSIVFSDISVRHRPSHSPHNGRNLKIYEKMMRSGRDFTPRDRYYYGRELMDAGQYEKSIEAFEAFLSGGGGWVEDEICACELCAVCLMRTGRPAEGKRYILRAFGYAPSRPGTLNILGEICLELGDTQSAVYCFECALASRSFPQGFVREADRDIIPLLWLCVCHDRLGNREKAMMYNDLARRVDPDDPSVRHNDLYFASAPPL